MFMATTFMLQVPKKIYNKWLWCSGNFWQKCISGPNDQRPILAKLEYVGQVEGILKLNYGVLHIVVLLCNWVKTNYTRSSVIVKQDEYGFTLVNFSSLIPILD
jgi:hypothetical protein